MIKNSIEYGLLSSYYGQRVASRSGVKLVNHINEGLLILEAIDATEEAMRAYCLHPLLQADDDLMMHYKGIAPQVSSYVMMLAIEYRSVANEYLSQKVGTGHIIRLSPLAEVNDMLIADKVQNYKDFLIHHADTHPRSKELDTYFNKWLKVLGIDKFRFNELVAHTGTDWA